MSALNQVNLIQGLTRRLDLQGLIRRTDSAITNGRQYINNSGPGSAHFEPTYVRSLMQEVSTARNELVRYLNRFSPDQVRQSGLEREANLIIGHLDRNYRELANLDEFFTCNYSELRNEAMYLASLRNHIDNYFQNPTMFNQLLPRVQQLSIQLNDLSKRFGPSFGQIANSLQQLAKQIHIYRAFVQSGKTDQQIRQDWQTRRDAIQEIINQIESMTQTINVYLGQNSRSVHTLDPLLEGLPSQPSQTPYVIRAVEFVTNELNDLISQLDAERTELQTNLIQATPRPIMQRLGIQMMINHFVYDVGDIYDTAVQQREDLEERIGQMQAEYNQMQNAAANAAEEHLEEVIGSSGSEDEQFNAIEGSDDEGLG